MPNDKPQTTCPNCHGEGAIVTVGGSRNTCEECCGVGHTGSPFAPRETDIPQFYGAAKIANECVECGEKALCQPPLFTSLNKVGPLCIGCYAEAEEQEQVDNGQFGLGA